MFQLVANTATFHWLSTLLSDYTTASFIDSEILLLLVSHLLLLLLCPRAATVSGCFPFTFLHVNPFFFVLSC